MSIWKMKYHKKSQKINLENQAEEVAFLINKKLTNPLLERYNKDIKEFTEKKIQMKNMKRGSMSFIMRSWTLEPNF